MNRVIVNKLNLAAARDDHRRIIIERLIAERTMSPMETPGVRVQLEAGMASNTRKQRNNKRVGDGQETWSLADVGVEGGFA